MKRDAEKLKARESRELARREKQLGARSNKYYLVYLFMILALIYITDEIASTISIQFQTNIVTEFFVQNMGMEYGEGLSLFSGLGFITYPVTLLIVLYRPLADRFGRKPFLIVNTLTMALGLFIVYLSSNIYVYMIGSTLMGFMVSHDMQCVYILECSSEKTRARNYAMVKAVAILGTLLVPLLRETLMKNVSERWHLVYLVPAIIGFSMSLFALLFARETNAFLIKRIAYLKTPLEERERQSKEEREANSQGNIINAVKFAFKHRQLRFLIVACCFFYLASLATSTYSTVMSQSAGMSEADITAALYLYPVGNALFTFIAGMVSDKFGRKKTILMGVVIAVCAFIPCIFFNDSMEKIGLMIGFTVCFLVAGFGLVIINVNTLPMVTELAKGSNVGQYTGYYYVASMTAQAITPIVGGAILDHTGDDQKGLLFVYGIACIAVAFVTMFFTKHGDNRPERKKKVVEYFGEED